MGFKSAWVRRSLRLVWIVFLFSGGPLLLLMMVEAGTLLAQEVSGRLVDEGTGEPVGGASVMLLDHEEEVVAGTFTDEDGTFLLQAPRLGRYTIQADRIGYRRTTSPHVDLRRGEVVEVELRLSTEAVPVAPLTVVGDRPALVLHPWLLRKGFYERRERYGRDGLFSGHFMDPEEIRRLNPYRVSDVVGSVPGVWGRSPHRRQPGSITMGRGCSPTVYVDGWRVSGDIDRLVPASTLVGVEVYTSIPIPRQFYDSSSLITPALCGTVVLWTGP